MKSTDKFTDKAEVYAKYRPSYPLDYIEYLIAEAGLKEDCTIADIGSGTGILSRQLLERGFTVIGVEPNDNMRTVAEQTPLSILEYKQGLAHSLKRQKAKITL